MFSFLSPRGCHYDILVHYDNFSAHNVAVLGLKVIV